jgi:hypothetical protein
MCPMDCQTFASSTAVSPNTNATHLPLVHSESPRSSQGFISGESGPEATRPGYPVTRSGLTLVAWGLLAAVKKRCNWGEEMMTA